MDSYVIDYLDKYLSIESNYAVIIKGNYGIGKTYFYKNEINEFIVKKTSNGKPLIPVHISLFGIKNIDELQAQIFLSFLQLNKNGDLKFSSRIIKSISRGALSILGAGAIEDYLKDYDNGASLINFDRIVICFDDVDRKNHTFNNQEFFGFINSLVENNNAKILIIANENQLLKDKKYRTLKEKVIGVSLEFKPDVEKTFLSIINQRYDNTENTTYHEFLVSNKNIILELVFLNENNFRSLIYFLENFKYIFSQLILKKQEGLFENNFDEILESVLKYTFAICFEFKSGDLHEDNLESLKSGYVSPISGILETRDNSDTKKDFITIFLEKYFLNRDYKYYDSILNLVTCNHKFDLNLLWKEINDHFPSENGVRPAHIEVFDKLRYFDCLSLSDSEYKMKTNKLINYACQGKYSLKDIPVVFHFATRFNNVLQYDLERLKNRLMKSIETNIKNFRYNEFLRIHLNTDFIDNREDLEDLINKCEEVNQRIKEIEILNNANKLFEILENDFRLYAYPQCCQYG